jgi:hypothetical protein
MNYETLVKPTHAAESIYGRYIRTIGLELFSRAETSLADFLFSKYGMPIYLLTLDEVHQSTEQLKYTDRGKHLFSSEAERQHCRDETS